MRLPLVAGLGAAAIAFAIVALSVGIGGEPARAPVSQTAAPKAGSAAAAPSSTAGLEVFAQMGCGSCHTLAAAGSIGDFGPDLDQRLPMHTRRSLVSRIMASPGSIEDFGGMPTNFRERLTRGQLNQLVDFLLAAREAGP